jgi:RNA polymerase sigma factor (sigma-70 family)
MSESTSTPASWAPSCATPKEQSRWFADEVHVHDSQLKAYLRGSFPSIPDVEDVVQESYLRIWKVRAAQPIRSAKAFLFTVARHVALKVVRKNANAPFVALGDLATLRVLDKGPSAAEAVGVQEKIDLLADAVMALPSRCREIVILHKLQGLPQREVAERLGLSARTVEGQVRIGVKRCLGFLQKHGVTNFFGDEL